MKRWLRLAVFIFLLVYIAGNGIALSVIAVGFQSEIGRERERTAFQHQTYISELSRRTALKRIEEKRLLLSRKETEELIASFAEEIKDQAFGFTAVYNKRKTSDTLQIDILESLPDFTDAVTTTENRMHIVIAANDEASYLLCGSSLRLDGIPYAIYTAMDVTEYYTEYAFRGRLCSLLCLVCAGIAAGASAGLTRRTDAAFERVQDGMLRLAGGTYNLRLPAVGGKRSRRLTETFNDMAEAVGDKLRHLQKLAENRKQFIDNLAHEMKTPLTSILGFADILRIKKTVDDKQRREFAAIIVEETKRLRGLSGKLLELATTDSVELEREWLSVQRLFEEIYVSMVPVLHQRKLTLSYAAGGDVQIYADKELFKSLLYNLVENSAKASGEGQEIQMRCSVSRHHVRISVTDQGIGMSEEHLKHVTEPFYMVDKSRSRKAGGAGLGLALCMEIVKRHGARLSLQSVRGKGTTVTVTMPKSENGTVST